jgi:hypothetical protein
MRSELPDYLTLQDDMLAVARERVAGVTDRFVIGALWCPMTPLTPSRP